MTCTPTESVIVDSVAIPLFTGAVPSEVVLSKKVTVPAFGTPAWLDMVAVRVSVRPYGSILAEALTAVIVVAESRVRSSQTSIRPTALHR